MTFEHGVSSLHIIESVKESDGEPGKALRDRLRKKDGIFAEFPIYVHNVFGSDEMRTTLEEIYVNEASKGLNPILHFEGHGSEQGFCFRDDATITWRDLADELTRFNVATRFHLLAVFSCCDGYQQIHSRPIGFEERRLELPGSAGRGSDRV